MHQKARHFKCDVCFKKLSSGIGLAVHQHQMHNKQIKGYVTTCRILGPCFYDILTRLFLQTPYRVPNAHSGRDTVEREIFGMDGLTAEEIRTIA